MKKFVITISLAFIIIAVVLLILVGFRSRDSFVPSYRFLAGRNPITCEKAKTGNEDKRCIYSFEADFNDVCSNADAELRSAGFAAKGVVRILSGNESRERYYWLKSRFPRGPVWIYIYDNRQYVDLHDLYENTPKSKHYAIGEKDGWVEVEVVYWRGWRWPF